MRALANAPHRLMRPLADGPKGLRAHCWALDRAVPSGWRLRVLGLQSLTFDLDDRGRGLLIQGSAFWSVRTRLPSRSQPWTIGIAAESPAIDHGSCGVKFLEAFPRWLGVFPRIPGVFPQPSCDWNRLWRNSGVWLWRPPSPLDALWLRSLTTAELAGGLREKQCRRATAEKDALVAD